MDLKTLYREVILDHYKKPRNSKELSNPSHEARCKNPSCGDRVTLQLSVNDGVVEALGLLGNGCAISQASASMMTVAVKGKTMEQARLTLSAFRAMIVEGEENPDKDTLGDLITMQGVAKLHARVKCAMCGWSALEAALDQNTDEIDMDHDKSMPASQK